MVLMFSTDQEFRNKDHKSPLPLKCLFALVQSVHSDLREFRSPECDRVDSTSCLQGGYSASLCAYVFLQGLLRPWLSQREMNNG